MKYKNCGVVVTGGSHGIGKEIILEFVREGAKICFIDINANYDQKLNNDSIFFYQGDVSKQEDLNQFVKFCFDKLTTIDILINNACVSHKGILSHCDYEGFSKTLALGLIAPYYLSYCFQEQLKNNSGNIINIASTRAFQSEPDSESYASAKGGIVALTHALSASLAGQVRVNCIAPGWIDVHDTEHFAKEDMLAIPAGKVGKPQDIAKIVLFLCSEEASFITGETITVDGGMSKRMIYHGEYGWKYHV